MQSSRSQHEVAPEQTTTLDLGGLGNDQGIFWKHVRLDSVYKSMSCETGLASVSCVMECPTVQLSEYTRVDALSE